MQCVLVIEGCLGFLFLAGCITIRSSVEGDVVGRTRGRLDFTG